MTPSWLIRSAGPVTCAATEADPLQAFGPNLKERCQVILISEVFNNVGTSNGLVWRIYGWILVACFSSIAGVGPFYPGVD
jgi:hypothetical protein